MSWSSRSHSAPIAVVLATLALVLLGGATAHGEPREKPGPPAPTNTTPSDRAGPSPPPSGGTETPGPPAPERAAPPDRDGATPPPPSGGTETPGPPAPPSGGETPAPPPATAPPAPPQPEAGSGDEQSQGDLDFPGSTSPLCDADDNTMKLQAGGEAQRNCRLSGTISQSHPTSSYGLDEHSDVSLTKPATIFPNMLHGICQLLWTGLLYLVRGVLLLLELAFSNDLVNRAMTGIEESLLHLDYVFQTQGLHVAAISVLGLWGLWTGLVRRKTIQTVGGLAAAIGLMVAAQVITYQPDATVGHVARLASQGALAALSGASTGTVDHPADSFAEAHQQLFDSLVVRPWCALQFTDVNGCMKVQPGKGDQPPLSIADVWLAYPANSRERDLLYKHRDGKSFKFSFTAKECKDSTARKVWNKTIGNNPIQKAWNKFSRWGCEKINGREGSDKEVTLKYDDDALGVHTDPGIQGRDGAFTRLALIGMIGVGLIGAMCVLLWIGIRLLLAGLFSLVLILLTPVVFLLAAFGEAGRRSVLAWGQKLLGLLIAKFVFALLLAVVVLVVRMLNSLDFAWFPLWMLNLAFWWGMLLKRHDLLSFLTLDRRVGDGGLGLSSGGGGGGAGLSSVYYGWRMTRDAMRAASAPVRMATNAGRNHAAQSAARASDHSAERDAQRADAVDSARETDRDSRSGETAAVQEHDRTALGEEGRRARDTEQQRDDMRRYRGFQRERRKAEQELRTNRRRQTKLDEKLPARYRPQTERERAIADEREALQNRERQLTGQLGRWRDDPDRIKRPAIVPGRPLRGRELDDYIAERREEVATLAPDHDRNLLAAGIDPDHYRAAGAVEKQRLRERSERAMEQSRTLLQTVGNDRPLSRSELRRAWQRIDAEPGGARARERSREEKVKGHRATVERNLDRRREEARRSREHDRERRARRPEDEVWARARRRMR